jgi:hypothetical protein
MIGSGSLPPLYAGWVDAMLGAPIPPETNATCGDCAMVVPPDARGNGETGFDPGVKCCTYQPDLWNFLVGGVLLDDGPESRLGLATVEARIDAGVAVTPLGLGKSRVFQLLYRHGTEAFGQSRSLLCPHFVDVDGGLCGVWKHRESTCATWFCKFVRGAIGKEFWGQLQQVLRVVERAVSCWCLLELGLDEESLARLYRPHRSDRPPEMSGSDFDGEPNLAELRGIWGAWRGRERDFYRECARIAASLAWTDVARLGGAELDVHTRLTRRAYARLMSTEVPDRLEAALIQITPRGDRARLTTYSGIDALDVPAALARSLPYFDGRPTAIVLEEIGNRERLRIDPSLVRKLADFGVLREAGPTVLKTGKN